MRAAFHRIVRSALLLVRLLNPKRKTGDVADCFDGMRQKVVANSKLANKLICEDGKANEAGNN